MFYSSVGPDLRIGPPLTVFRLQPQASVGRIIPDAPAENGKA